MKLKPFLPVWDTRLCFVDSDVSYIQARYLLNFLACIAFSVGRHFYSVSVKFTLVTSTKHKHLRKHIIEATHRKVARGYGLIKCNAEIPKLVEAGSVSLCSVVRDRLVLAWIWKQRSHTIWASKSWPLVGTFLLELGWLGTVLSVLFRVTQGA